MPDNINIDMSLSTNQPVANLQKMNSALVQTDKALLSVSNTMKELNSGGRTFTEVIKSQTSAFAQRTVTTKQLADGTQRLTVQIKENTIARQKAIAKTKEQTLQARRVSAAFARGQKELKKGTLSNVRVTKQLDAATARLITTYRGTSKAGKEVTLVYTHVNGKLKAVTRSSRDAAIATKKLAAAQRVQKGTTKSLIISFKNMSQIIGVLLVRRAITAFIGGVRDSIAEVIELRKRLAEIQSIAQDKPLGIDKWTKEITELSKTSGFDILDTAEATYQTLSNQVAKGTQTFKFMAEAQRFAILTNATLTDSVGLLSSALNSYGETSDRVEVIASKMFKTIELGRVRASEIANTLGRVTVVSSQLGVSLDELNALLALTSVRGLKARQTLTQIRGVMNALLKPSKEMQKFLKSIGEESGQGAIATFGLTGVIKKMAEAADGNIKILSKWVPRIRGLSSAIVATSDKGQTFIDTVEKMSTAQENYVQGVTLTTENAGKRVAKALNIIDLAFIQAGKTINDVMNSIVGDLDRFETRVNSITKVFGFLANVIANVIELAYTANPMKDYIDWSIRVLDLHGESRLAVIKLQKAQTEANRVAERELQNKVEATKKANKKIVQSAREVISDETVILDKALDSSYSIVKKTSDNFKLAYTAAGKQMAATAKVITNSIKAAESRIKKLKSSTKALIGSLQDEIFNESLSRQGADQQVKSVVAEIKRLNIERKKAELAGATDLAVSLLKKESDLAIQLVKLDKDRVVERKKIDKELVKLAEDYKKDSAKKQTANERNKLRDQYKKESADLLAERAKVDDKSVGQYAKKYRSIYTELIKMAEEQQARLFKVELARIKKAGDAEKAALAELAIYKLQLKKIESFDIEKSLDGAKDKAAIDAIMVKRAEELNNLAIKTGALSKSEERTAALLAINEQKKVEQTAAELKIKILNQEIRKKALEDNRAAIADEEDAIVKRRAASAETLDAAIIRYRVIVADLAKQKKYLDVIKLESTKYDEAKRKLEFLERVKSRIMTDEIKKTGELNRLLKLQVGLLNSIKAAPASPAKGVVLPAKPRADGGQAYGSDSVSAMLSPGEYVVNAASSRKFYSQLVGMNGGNNNLRLADGGTTVGDINVNMSSSGNENYDASKLAQGLRRGIRRGTISL